jgi:uncharacterized protein YidB (DUF937 family)
MGLLDQVMNSVTGGPGAKRPGLGGTIAAGVILALAVKAVRSYDARRAATAGQPAGAGPQASPTVQGGESGGLLGGLGGLLGGLGGAGALGGLISQLQAKGYGKQVNSWVGTGQNEPIAPHQLAEALGEDTVKELEQHTGMPRQALLDDLATTLPQAVNELTPKGREPDDDELHAIAAQPASG